ncbi:MAG: molybdopterin-dependent oxidoreductase, partial [Candidatus Nanopelagicales bacterium]
EHCASGCAQRTDTRRGTIMRRLAAVDPNVNEEWNCDKGRFAFRYVDAQDRLATPMIREDGALRPASWAEALDATAAGLRANRDKTGVITGGRLSVEDALAYSAFARVALGTNNIDFRARASSQEEEAFLAAHVAGSGLGPTYADLETAPAVLLVCLEPEDESPILMLRLRKAMREFGTAVYSVSPTASPGLLRMNGKVVPTAPGGEPQALDSMSTAADGPGVMLRAAGSVILVGERASSLPGTLSAVVRLAESTGATVGWVPRRAGERGAVEAGLLPSLLPGGRPVADAAARVDAAAVWGVPSVQESNGLDLPHMLEAAAKGDLTALVFAGVDPTDVPGDAVAAATRATFVVVLDTRQHELADLADVVFPVASSPEKAGTFLNWEGRLRPFDQAIRPTNLMSDARVLSAIANELGVTLNSADLADVRAQLGEFDGWLGARVGSPSVAAPNPSTVGAKQLLLHTWQPLINGGALQQDEPYFAATGRPAEVALSDSDATTMGLADGDLAVVTGDRGALTANVVVADVVTGVAVLSGDRARELGGKSGDLVTVTKGGAR